MLKTRQLLLSTLCLAASAGAYGHSQQDSISVNPVSCTESMLHPLEPDYLKNVCEAANWGKNWFIEAKGGASAFLGSPVGCGDVFDRLTPALQVGVGKWFTPAVGGRVEYQGLSFKNAEFKSMEYHFVHADFMYNLTSSLWQNEKGLSRWDIIPYAGVGMIWNRDWQSNCMCPGHASGSHPFAFSYGIEGRYRLCDRLHIIAEISGMTTARNFDCIGASSKFGDNMLTLSAGLSLTLGKVGYSRIVDASPYIAQNEWLLSYAKGLSDRNQYLMKHLQEDDRLFAEYQKILEIEGLLDMYGDKLSRKDRGNEDSVSLYPHNDYSGLNSLRARMNNRGWDGNPETMPKAMKKRGASYDKNSSESMDALLNSGLDDDMQAYFKAMMNGGEAIGAPVYFFFNIGTADLTDASQLLNIDEIVKVAKKYGLKVHITGAADSATGTDSLNDTLSRKRAQYIKNLLVERGIVDERIKTDSEGGIDDYSPVQANRNTSIILTF